MSKPREFTLKYDHDYQYKDGVPASIITTDFKSAGIGDDERVKVIEKTPHVSKCIALHDEMLAVLKATLESLLPYDKDGKMSAIVIAVCDVIKKAEAP